MSATDETPIVPAPDPRPMGIARARTTRASILVVVMLVVGALVVGGVLWKGARDLDKTAAAQSVDLARSLLESKLRRLGVTATDYSYWDEAVEKLAVELEAGWADANIGGWLYETYGISHSLVLDAENRLVIGFIDGVLSSEERLPAWQGGLDRLTAAAHESPPDAAVPATGLLALDGLVHLVAVSALTPLEMPELWDPRRPRYLLVLAAPLDDTTLAELEADFGLDGIRAIEASTRADTLPLVAPDGTRLGSLTWNPETPGSALIDDVSGPVAVAFALMCLLCFVVFRHIERAAREDRAKTGVIAAKSLELRRLAALKQATLSSIGEGIAVFDKDGRLVYCNGNYADMFGLPPELHAAGTPLATIEGFAAAAGHRVLERAERNDAGRFADETACTATVEIGLANGRVLEMRCGPMPEGGIVNSYRDITHRKHAEEAVRAAHEEAERANQAKTGFLAKMSHELRTPLNAIIGFSEMMQRESLGPLGVPTYRDYLGHILDSGKLLLSLVNDLLDINKIEAGKFELQREAVDASEMVRSTLAILASRAKVGGLRVDLALPEDLPLVDADPRALRQILLNLLTNAVKFTDAGGSITVSAEPQADETVRISVADTGIGSAAADLSRVMEPFGQVRNARTQSQEGTGLGLPISRALTELHGGRFALASTLGAGTTVAVELPVYRKAA